MVILAGKVRGASTGDLEVPSRRALAGELERTLGDRTSPVALAELLIERTQREIVTRALKASPIVSSLSDAEGLAALFVEKGLVRESDGYYSGRGRGEESVRSPIARNLAEENPRECSNLEPSGFLQVAASHLRAASADFGTYFRLCCAAVTTLGQVTPAIVEGQVYARIRPDAQIRPDERQPESANPDKYVDVFRGLAREYQRRVEKLTELGPKQFRELGWDTNYPVIWISPFGGDLKLLTHHRIWAAQKAGLSILVGVDHSPTSYS